jgi:hypothetical protein
MIDEAVLTKTENIYCAFSPELKIFAYGACREEALNGLQEEADRRTTPHRRSYCDE